MLGVFAVLLFSLALLVFLVLEFPVVYALVLGYVIFTGYGLIEGHSFKKLLKMSWKGISTVKNILLVLILIGIVTAIWRASGTIAFIIYSGSKVITPSLFVLLAFLLCALLSTLIGTSLGTAATMGVICISLARAMGIDEKIVGGAIISGIYVGDRWSPMSSSALLVAEITKTDIFENIKEMIKTSWLPFLFTCFCYLLLGFGFRNSEISTNTTQIFQENYNLTAWTIIPALLIILFSLFKVNMKITLSVSILVAAFLAFTFQQESLGNLLSYSLFGYSSQNEELNAMMKGGGILSMLPVSLIVGISSSYSGIFEGTEILTKLREYIQKISPKITAFGAVLLTAIISSGIACNQSLSSILTNQLCQDIMPKKERAIAIENTVILVAALIPWSVAMAVPFRTMEVGNGAIFFGIYLYAVPLWNLLLAIYHRKKNIL